MNKTSIGGIALLGGAILAGVYIYKKSNSSDDVTDLRFGGSGLGTGGSTLLTPTGEPTNYITPGAENIASPFVVSSDSIARGIEDVDTPSTRGITEVSDSGTYDTSASDISSLFGEIAPWAGLGIVQSASKKIIAKSASAAEGSLLSRIAGGALGGALRTTTKVIPVVGSATFAVEMLTGKAGDGGYTGELYDPSNTVIKDIVDAQMAAAKTVSGVPADSSNYGVSDTPTLTKADKHIKKESK